MKTSKRLNKIFKNYCNFYWAKYVQSGMIKEISFEKYLGMCHIFENNLAIDINTLNK